MEIKDWKTLTDKKRFTYKATQRKTIIIIATIKRCARQKYRWTDKKEKMVKH